MAPLAHRIRDFFRRSPLGTAAACAFLIAAVWVTFNTRRWNHREIFQWDTDGYYLYLPAALIHADPLHLGFLDSIQPGTFPKDYRFGQGAFFVEETQRYCNKYSMGTAVFELPFFLAAHAWCALFSPHEADGYSPPYQLAIALASAFWPWLGLLVLLRFLRRSITDAHAAITVVAIGMGTNLFFYSSFAGGMSHPFLFFLCALLIERTDRWYTAPSLRTALAIGACIGLATLTRPTCALFAVIPLCWRIRDNGPRLLRAHAPQLGAAVCIAFTCVVPQLVYWKVTTGSFLFYSYGGETFDFTHPHVLEGLFSFRKGWFVYTPLALTALLGLLWMRRDIALRSYPMMLACFLVPFIHITFSWDPWWYGGSFGSRPMIDTLPLMALPMAFLVKRSLEHGPIPRIAFAALLLGCVTLNLFQQWQYQRGIIHCCEMTMERWWLVFGEPTTIGLPSFP